MKLNRNKIPLIIALLFVALISFSVWIIFKNPNTRPYDERAAREPEVGGPSLVILQNSETLSRVLLPAQFIATKIIVNDFVKQTYGEPSKVVTIIGEARLSEKGVVAFDAQVNNDQTKTFTAIIDKWSSYNQLIFSVPEKNFTQTVLVYSN